MISLHVNDIPAHIRTNLFTVKNQTPQVIRLSNKEIPVQKGLYLMHLDEEANFLDDKELLASQGIKLIEVGTGQGVRILQITVL